MRRLLLRYLRDQNGATVLEYAWIASLISIAAVGAFYSIGQKMQNWLWPAANALAS